VTLVAGAGTQGPGISISGAVRLTWVTDHLAHVIDSSQIGEASGTWTGLACPDHELPIGSDVDNATLLRLVGQGEIADLVWEAPEDFTAGYGQLCGAAIQAHQSGSAAEGERLWQQAMGLWSHAWEANYQVLELMQETGVARFSPVKPQRWVIASFEHHTSPHGLPAPHVHNIVIPALTASARG
jgi:hypothetical protein